MARPRCPLPDDLSLHPGSAADGAGIYAYKTVFSLIMFLQSLDRADEGMRYMQQFFLNATVSLSVIALLAAGATLPIFIFKRRAFSMTRRTRKNS